MLERRCKAASSRRLPSTALGPDGVFLWWHLKVALSTHHSLPPFASPPVRDMHTHKYTHTRAKRGRSFMSASCSLFHLEPRNDPQMRRVDPTREAKITLHGNPLPRKKKTKTGLQQLSATPAQIVKLVRRRGRVPHYGRPPLWLRFLFGGAELESRLAAT